MAHVCTKCNGKGVVGNGENPENLEGKVVTCDACQGTGRVSEEPVEAPKGVVSEPSNDPVEEVKADEEVVQPTE